MITALFLHHLLLLQERLFGTSYVEIVVPTIVSVGDTQFVGCLIPIELISIGEAKRIVTQLTEKMSEVAIVTKFLGERNQQCLSVLIHPEKQYSRKDLDSVAERVGEFLTLTYGMPYLVVRIINSREARVRLT